MRYDICFLDIFIDDGIVHVEQRLCSICKFFYVSNEQIHTLDSESTENRGTRKQFVVSRVTVLKILIYIYMVVVNHI